MESLTGVITNTIQYCTNNYTNCHYWPSNLEIVNYHYWSFNLEKVKNHLS